MRVSPIVGVRLPQIDAKIKETVISCALGKALP